MFEIGDIVQVNRSYPYISIDKVRGIVKRKEIHHGITLYQIRIPPKFLKRKSGLSHDLIVVESEIEKVEI